MVATNRLDALLNEYKGNIFEYLTCQFVARYYGVEKVFLENLTEDMLSILEQQESYLRNYFPYLLKELPKLADLTAKEIKKYLGEKSICKVSLLGKVLANQQNSHLKETDFILEEDNGQIYPVSLKISKSGAYVNSKSAGLKTFFLKYFSLFSCEQIQQQFNEFCDYHYEEMAIAMHAEADIEYEQGFKNWVCCGMEVLPGQLEEQYRHYLLDYYAKVNAQLLKLLKELYDKDQKIFAECLKALIGFSYAEIIQVTAFYKLKDGVFDHHWVHIVKNEELKVLDFKMRKNNFDILLHHLALQIRVKPMNTFTAKAFKINCAVKYNSTST
jgi:hypothetical protein